MLKKPVICTENLTVANYIDSSADGLIIKKDADSIEKALQYLEEHYSDLNKKAREKFVNKYTEYRMGLNILDSKKFWQSDSRMISDWI